MTRRYVVPGPPVPYDRAISTTDRTTGKAIRVHSAKYRKWRSQAAIDIRRQGGAFVGVPLTVDVYVGERGIEFSVAPAVEGPVRPTGIRGDVDNYAKAVLDALQSSGVIDNDRRVVRLSVQFVSPEVL